MTHQNMSMVEEIVKDGGCVLATAHGGGESGLLLVAKNQDDRISFFPELNREWLQRSWSGGSGFWFFCVMTKSHSITLPYRNTSIKYRLIASDFLTAEVYTPTGLISLLIPMFCFVF